MRTALIDSSLLARKSARRFVGLLAELNDVALVSTSETEEEMPRAVRNVMQAHASSKPLAERVDEALSEYYNSTFERPQYR